MNHFYHVHESKQYRRDVDRVTNRKKDIHKLETLVKKILDKEVLDPSYKHHYLSGEYIGCEECHIEPNWLLIFLRDDVNKVIYLLRTGTHSDLYKNM